MTVAPAPGSDSPPDAPETPAPATGKRRKKTA